MAFCSLPCMRSYTAMRQYNHGQVSRDWERYHREWRERLEREEDASA